MNNGDQSVMDANLKDYERELAGKDKLFNVTGFNSLNMAVDGVMGTVNPDMYVARMELNGLRVEVTECQHNQGATKC